MRRLLLIAVLALAVLAPAAHAYPRPVSPSGLATASLGGAPVRPNPPNRLLATPIEASVYDPATHCDAHARPGMLALQSWLSHHVAGAFWGSHRCEKWGRHSASLHAENRAIDWHLDAHEAADRAAAARLFALLLAPDRAGNPQALARRMGVEELIFDCGYWSAGMPDFRPYSPCFKANGEPRKLDDTTAHRNHIHIGMTKAGAARRTGFWR